MSAASAQPAFLPLPPGQQVSPRPIAPGQCPPGTLPQYCSTQMGRTQFAGPPPGVAPYNCPLGSTACINQNMQNLAGGCPPGPYQSACMQRRAQVYNGLLNQPPKPKEDIMKKIMPLLNALGGGGGGGGNGVGSGGERMAGSDGHNHGGAINRDPRSSTTSVGSVNREAGPIVEPFQRHFPKCTNSLGLGECTFNDQGIMGDARHQRGRSCHNSRQAWDIGFPFVCSTGGTIQADDAKALEIAKCLADQTNNELGIIFRDIQHGPNMFPASKLGMHNGHIHVQLRNCQAI